MRAADREFAPGDPLYEKIPVRAEQELLDEAEAARAYREEQGDGREVPERGDKVDPEISDADVEGMELAMDAAHEAFIERELAKRHAAQ